MTEEKDYVNRIGLHLAPHQRATNERDIRELIDWAIEQQYMLKIVYSKPTANGMEVSKRIVLPLAVHEGYLLKTELVATVREDIGEVEISTEADYFRSFAIIRIDKAEPFIF